jgi:hypothetical protein
MKPGLIWAQLAHVALNDAAEIETDWPPRSAADLDDAAHLKRLANEWFDRAEAEGFDGPGGLDACFGTEGDQ